MSRYIFKRLAVFVPQLLAVTVATFLLVRLAPNNNPAALILGPTATPEAMASVNQSLGLDQPIFVQYWIYLTDVLRGDLGTSWFTGQSVGAELLQRAPATLELIFYSILVGMGLGIPLGIIAAEGRGIFGKGVRWGTRFAGAFPDFWVALMAIYLFYTVLGIAPAPTGRLALGETPPTRITGFYTFDSILTGNMATLGSSIAHLVLPAGTLGVALALIIGRATRVSFAQAFESGYIRYAEACGLSRATIMRYTLRNALPPVLTLGGVLITTMLGGVVLLEKVFSWGGVGQYAVQAVSNSDFLAIQGFLLLAAWFTMVIYLAVDVTHILIDPRLRN